MARQKFAPHRIVDHVITRFRASYPASYAALDFAEVRQAANGTLLQPLADFHNALIALANARRANGVKPHTPDASVLGAQIKARQRAIEGARKTG